MNRLRKFCALPPAGRAFVAQNILLLPVIAVLLRTVGFARTRALLERREKRRQRIPPVLAPREIARLVDAPAVLLGVGCLARSLVLWHALAARAVASEIRFGVAGPCRGEVSVHAWVELEGVPLNDTPDVAEHFAVLPGSFASD